MTPAETMNTLPSEELQRRVLAEMRALDTSGAGLSLEIGCPTAFAIVAFCQLALRHPAAAQYDAAAHVTRFIDYVRAKFEPHAPAIAEAIRRGNDPQHDTPREPEPPEMEQERALLRRLLNSRDPLENARLTFGHDKHQIIFQRIMDLHERGAPVDRVALANELMKNGELQAIGGLTYLVTLYEPPREPE